MCHDRMNKNIVWSSVSFLCYAVQVRFSPMWHLWLAKQMNQLLVPRWIVGWVLKILLYLELLPLAPRALCLYFLQLCLSSSVISQKIRFPVHLMSGLVRCKIIFFHWQAATGKKKFSSAEPSARLINYCSVWVSDIPTVTARFPSLWVGLFDFCDLPGGRPVIQ